VPARFLLDRAQIRPSQCVARRGCIDPSNLGVGLLDFEQQWNELLDEREVALTY